MIDFWAFWSIVGHVMTAITLVGVVVIVVGCVAGFVPVLIRLGMSLWRRKIAIFAHGDAMLNLRRHLDKSRLFSSRNIIEISTSEALPDTNGAGVMLVYWPQWADRLPELLTAKKDSTSLILYAPQAGGLLPREAIALLEEHRNVMLCNFRGRLLNDLLISMITTGHEKR
jgi:hypothetical protein